MKFEQFIEKCPELLLEEIKSYLLDGDVVAPDSELECLFCSDADETVITKAFANVKKYVRVLNDIIDLQELHGVSTDYVLKTVDSVLFFPVMEVATREVLRAGFNRSPNY